MKSLLLVFGIGFIVNAMASYLIYRKKQNVEVVDFSITVFVTAIILRPLLDGGIALWPVVAISAVVILPIFILGPMLIEGVTSYVWKDFQSVCNKVGSFYELKGATEIKNKNYSIYKLEDGTKVKVTKTVGDNRTKVAVTSGLHIRRALEFRKKLMPVLKRIDNSNYNPTQAFIYGGMGIIAIVAYVIL